MGDICAATAAAASTVSEGARLGGPGVTTTRSAMGPWGQERQGRKGFAVLQLGPPTPRRSGNAGGAAGLGQTHVRHAQLGSDGAHRVGPDPVVQRLAGEDVVSIARLRGRQRWS